MKKRNMKRNQNYYIKRYNYVSHTYMWCMVANVLIKNSQKKSEILITHSENKTDNNTKKKKTIYNGP